MRPDTPTSGSVPPDVSVVLPAFNASATIEQALRSIQAQVNVRCETLVIDDGSTDGTAAVVRDLALPGVRLLCQERNQGVSVARNRGIALAQGEYIAFLDADDVWKPTKLERQLAVMRAHPAASLVSCECEGVAVDGRPIACTSYARLPWGRNGWKMLLRAGSFATPTVLCRRADLHRVGGFRPELRVGEDLDLWIRLACLGEVHVVAENLVTVYQLTTGLSHTQPLGEVRQVLPMIVAHVTEAGDRLTAPERRAILGTRHFDLGYRTYLDGHLREALPLFRRSAALGWRRTRSLVFLIDCATGGMLRRLRHGPSAPAT